MSLIVLDLEVIVNAKGMRDSEIIEIGACRLEKEGGRWEIKDTFSSLVHPIFHKKIPKRVTKLTNITTDMVKDAPTFDKVWEDFKSFAGENPKVLAWGVNDKAWFEINCRHMCLPYRWLTSDYIDFQEEYKEVNSLALSPSLQTAVEREGLDYDKEKLHRAPEDAYQCARVFKKVYKEKGGVL